MLSLPYPRFFLTVKTTTDLDVISDFSKMTSGLNLIFLPNYIFEGGPVTTDAIRNCCGLAVGCTWARFCTLALFLVQRMTIITIINTTATATEAPISIDQP